MKKALSSIAVVSLLVFASCGGSKTANPLLGKWAVKKVEQGPKMADEMKKQMDENMATLKSMGGDSTMNMDSVSNAMKAQAADAEKQMNDAMMNMTMEFKADSSVTMTAPGKTSDGKYSLSTDGKSLTIHEGGEDQVFTVNSMNDKELVLDMEGMATLHFEKAADKTE